MYYNVKAAPSVKVPREDKPTTYIDDTAPVTIAPSVYYRRRIVDGDLIVLGRADAQPLTTANDAQPAPVAASATEGDGSDGKE